MNGGGRNDVTHGGPDPDRVTDEGFSNQAGDDELYSDEGDDSITSWYGAEL